MLRPHVVICCHQMLAQPAPLVRQVPVRSLPTIVVKPTYLMFTMANAGLSVQSCPNAIVTIHALSRTGQIISPSGGGSSRAGIMCAALKLYLTSAICKGAVQLMYSVISFFDSQLPTLVVSKTPNHSP